MSLRRFLDCAYAILIEEYTRLGTDLLSAIEKVDESLGLRDPLERAERQASPADNDRALAELQKMMGGIA